MRTFLYTSMNFIMNHYNLQWGEIIWLYILPFIGLGVNIRKYVWSDPTRVHNSLPKVGEWPSHWFHGYSICILIDHERHAEIVYIYHDFFYDVILCVVQPILRQFFWFIYVKRHSKTCVQTGLFIRKRKKGSHTQ